MRPHLPLVILIGSIATGCINTNQTVIKDEPRLPVSFENDTAGRVFYEALSRIPGTGDSTESRSEVSLPIVFHHETKTVRGPNHGFNDAVRRCDTNQDGIITETEARIFAGTVP